jgi:hypothetical protein
MSALSVQDVKDYLGIDFADDATDRLVTAMVSTADAYMKGALGAGYPADDERVKMVAKIIISDLYDNRDLFDKASGSGKTTLATRRLVDSMLQQVRLEMRAAGDSA